jgi:hypothetical protein
VGLTLRWVLEGEPVGPLTGGPVTARRAAANATHTSGGQLTPVVARHAARGARPGWSTPAWCALTTRRYVADLAAGGLRQHLRIAQGLGAAGRQPWWVRLLPLAAVAASVPAAAQRVVFSGRDARRRRLRQARHPGMVVHGGRLGAGIDGRPGFDAAGPRGAGPAAVGWPAAVRWPAVPHRRGSLPTLRRTLGAGAIRQAEGRPPQSARRKPRPLNTQTAQRPIPRKGPDRAKTRTAQRPGPRRPMPREPGPRNARAGHGPDRSRPGPQSGASRKRHGPQTARPADCRSGGRAGRGRAEPGARGISSGAAGGPGRRPGGRRAS